MGGGWWKNVLVVVKVDWREVENIRKMFAVVVPKSKRRENWLINSFPFYNRIYLLSAVFGVYSYI